MNGIIQILDCLNLEEQILPLSQDTNKDRIMSKILQIQQAVVEQADDNLDSYKHRL